MQTIKTGVAVIGGGGAAARAAYEARKAGAEVTLITKGSFAAIGTRGAGATSSGFSASGVFATPGWTGQLSQIETRVAHMVAAPLERSYSNILQAGLGMTDPRLARIMVEDAVDSRKTLIELGATFGEYGLRSHGVPIMAALVSQIKKSGINVVERTMVTRLLTESGECRGAIGVDENSGEIILVQAGAVIMATGGDSNLFMLNLNPSCNTADGYALGYECGAELMNLEFKQIFLGTVYPTRNMLTQTLPPNVKLTNANGEEFLQIYLPEGAGQAECLAQRNSHNPFSSRDTLSRYVDFAIVGELKAGRGTLHRGIFLDRSGHNNPPLTKPAAEFWAYRGIDFSQPVEACVCHHCSLGGFRIDANAETTVPGLFAAGEAAAGPHGADRMGGHMLLASQVFGARAGRNAAARATRMKTFEVDKQVTQPAVDKIESLRRHGGRNNPADLKRILQKAAYFDLLTIRSHDSLTRFLDEVKRIREDLCPDLSAATAQSLIDALELQNLLTAAEIEAEVCLARTESRGPHFRADFPQQNDRQWLRSITASRVGERLLIKTISLDPAWKSEGDEKMGYWG